MAALLVALAFLPAAGMGLDLFDSKEEKRQLKKARSELKQLEKRIKRKDIPPIEFELNKAILIERSKTTLELLADLMFKYPHLKLYISGHTCDIGNAEYNQILSQKRAQAVEDYLVEVGVMGEYIRATGYGEEKPLVPNDSNENREKNRRVEFHLTTRTWHSIY